MPGARPAAEGETTSVVDCPLALSVPVVGVIESQEDVLGTVACHASGQPQLPEAVSVNDCGEGLLP